MICAKGLFKAVCNSPTAFSPLIFQMPIPQATPSDNIVATPLANFIAQLSLPLLSLPLGGARSLLMLL